MPCVIGDPIKYLNNISNQYGIRPGMTIVDAFFIHENVQEL